MRRSNKQQVFRDSNRLIKIKRFKIKMTKLNVGCGTVKKRGYVNTDINPKHHPDVIWDIRKRSTFSDEQFEEIHCDSVLEHVQDFRPVMIEFHRILKKGGKLRITVPYMTCPFWDIPSHVRPFAYFTFYHYWKGYKTNRETEDIGITFNNIKVRYVFGKRIQVWNHVIEYIANLFPLIYETTGFKYLFPCWNIEVELTK